jgi:hypothetical protein
VLQGDDARLYFFGGVSLLKNWRYAWLMQSYSGVHWRLKSFVTNQLHPILAYAEYAFYARLMRRPWRVAWLRNDSAGLLRIKYTNVS